MKKNNVDTFETEKLITEQLRHQLLTEWNNTATCYPSDQSIAQVFANQAAETPDAVAVEFEERCWTYKELNAQANQLAHYLIELGITAEDRVGISLPRSPQLVVGILAILKAGGVYVPLDPSYPKERLAFLLEDAQVKILLTFENLFSQFPSSQCRFVCIDAEATIIAGYSGENPHITVTPEQLAYIIYTSGSTGTPKGVMVPQRGVLRLVFGVDYADFGPEKTFLLLAPITFDASTFELWGALLHGARCVIYADQIPTADRLEHIIRTRKISTLWLTAALFNNIIDTAPQALRGVHQLLTGGEALSVRHICRGLEKLPDTQIINGYGPTESTTFTCCYPIPRDFDPASSSVPIGRPIGNTRVFVLDEHLNPVAPGIAGELHIGGAGLARGYLNQTQLTAEKFIADPFCEDERSKLYKTGDLVRYLADGNIEFLRRMDQQVKLRGFRIEPGEIEAILVRNSCVSESVVILREMHADDKQLVAYIVPAHECEPSVTELRYYLQQKLPEYMVPAGYVYLQALPLTENGKVDRNALPEPAMTRPKLKQEFVAPRSQTETEIRRIWYEILQIEQIGVYDSFLELGGYSLLATQLLTVLKEDFGVELSLAEFYAEPNVAALSSIVVTNGDKSEFDKIPELKPALRSGHLPVSFAQEQLLFLNQLSPHSIAYNFQTLIYLNGQLDVASLEAALNEIVLRHEIFRTSFLENEGRGEQIILEAEPIFLPLVDLQDTPKETLKSRIDELIRYEMGVQFDIAQPPLIRWKLFKLDLGKHILLQVEHHLVHDGWSFAVLLDELRIIYTNFTRGLLSPLKDLSIQFADYAVWQQQWMQGEMLRSKLNYWKNELSGTLPILELPNDFKRPEMQSFSGAEVVREIPESLAEAIREACRAQEVTLFMFMFAAYFNLLFRYTNQDDIVVGTGVANRRSKESEKLIGMIINTISVRVALTDDMTVNELLRVVKTKTLNGFAHQDAPFSKVVNELKLLRDLSRNPVFQTLFSFHDSQVPDLELPELTGKIDYLHNGSAKFDLGIIVVPWAEQSTGNKRQTRNQGILMKWEYASDIFERASIERMTRHYRNILEFMVKEPDARLSELTMIDQHERRQLLFDWNNTTTPYPREQSIHQVFEACANTTPEAVAVEFEEQQCTYRELNRRANQLAHYLIELGIDSEDKVGICLHRSLDLVVGILGILKAGAVYVPLDPSYPEERLEFLLDDARVAILLISEQLASQLSEFQVATVILDAEQSKIAACNSDNLNKAVDSEQLAYIIYTSGSTGNPKGVMVPHRGVLRLVFGVDYASFGPDQTFLLLAPITFDASTFELWGALLHGSRCVIFPERIPTAEALELIIRSRKVTTLWLTAALFNNIIDTAPQTLSSVRQLLTGGEALSVRHIRRGLDLLPNTRLINGYGPTESTTFTCCYQIPHDLNPERLSVPIGRPIGNTRVYILDEQLNPAPSGVSGELYIAGAGLAKGYLNHQSLSDEKFIPDPFSDDPHERLYKSGDIVRYLADGNIEFIRRIDDQVKLRGFRIEPGEIEHALLRHPGLNAAIVVLRDFMDNDKQLVAYVVSALGVAPPISELRHFLKLKLPEYMLPSAYVFMDELPLTANGKIDRKALPEPEMEKSISQDGYREPGTAIEKFLAEIWQEVLGMERIGIYDNFFEIGGHSLLATQVVSRINCHKDYQLSLRQLFEAQTIEALCRVLETEQQTSD